jgi:sarcosine/dimethylglycine N-methyltransferase
MTDNAISDQYSTGLSRRHIERALASQGLDLDHITPADLAALEDFHTMGRIATGRLIDLLEITTETRVLDAGSGIGGSARFIADRYGCAVTAVDLTEEYCGINSWLNQLVGLSRQIAVHHADVTDLPFSDGSFDVAVSQHVQMNVVDKGRLYREARRVLVERGRLGLWDITRGGGGDLDFPLPWADAPDVSHVVTAERLAGFIEASGFAIEHWVDLSDEAAALMHYLLTVSPSPLGLHVFVADFAEKARNLTDALADGRLRVIQGVARAIA